jgi:hypothetical protein
MNNKSAYLLLVDKFNIIKRLWYWMRDAYPIHILSSDSIYNSITSNDTYIIPSISVVYVDYDDFYVLSTDMNYHEFSYYHTSRSSAFGASDDHIKVVGYITELD